MFKLKTVMTIQQFTIVKYNRSISPQATTNYWECCFTCPHPIRQSKNKTTLIYIHIHTKTTPAEDRSHLNRI